MSSPFPVERGPDETERVGIFSSWRALYAAVVLCALAVMALLALFSWWPF